jgi:hypothetical protein
MDSMKNSLNGRTSAYKEAVAKLEGRISEMPRKSTGV